VVEVVEVVVTVPILPWVSAELVVVHILVMEDKMVLMVFGLFLLVMAVYLVVEEADVISATLKVAMVQMEPFIFHI
jgi:hypothetical protein